MNECGILAIKSDISKKKFWEIVFVLYPKATPGVTR